VRVGNGRGIAAARRVSAWAVAPGLALILSLANARQAAAEFEIQESTIDPGEIQLQYRGAWHSGLPKETADSEAFLPDDEETPFRQTQEFELQMSVNSNWLLALTHGFDQPDGENIRLSAVEFESQLEIITLEGDGFGLAVQGGFEFPLGSARQEEAKEMHYGPIVEWAKGDFLLTLNPLFFKEWGELAEQDGYGFEYGWQAKYDVTGRLALALEMFGEVEDMANAGPFDDQVHSIGPAFYYSIEREWEQDGKERSRELVLSLGAQFGLTSATSDVALKVFVGYEYY
jgi:hypothetical protein